MDKKQVIFLDEDDLFNKSIDLICEAIKDNEQDMNKVLLILKRANKQLEQEVSSE